MLAQKNSFRIISGGQTGVDRAALDWAIDHAIPHGGWCPKGRKAEDGVIPERYNLQETQSRNYLPRTRRNVEAGDGTLILNLGRLEGGTLRTATHAKALGKPLHIVDLMAGEPDAAVRATISWIEDNGIVSLNVAGPRESQRPGIYRMAYDLLSLLARR